jgi:hypothetical protein
MNLGSASFKIAVSVFIVFVAYGVYSWYSLPIHEGFDINSQNYSEFKAPPPPPPTIIPLVAVNEVSLPGPPPENTVIVPPEEPYDPQDQLNESSDHPDRLRRPERSYGPGLEQNDTTTAVESGIASNSHMATMSAYQSFGPEFAQNGGQFMENGVVANDTSVKLEYSSV